VGGCATNTGASALNDYGDTLSWVGTWASGVRFEGIGSFSFGELIDPSQGVWYTGGGGDINNARQILVGVRDATYTQVGVALFDPIRTNGPTRFGPRKAPAGLTPR
jgi:hypothetical protein